MIFALDAAVAGLYMAKAEHELFEKSINGLSPAEKQAARDRRRDRIDAERRHREIVSAQQSNGSGMVGAGVIGFLLGLGMS